MHEMGWTMVQEQERAMPGRRHAVAPHIVCCLHCRRPAPALRPSSPAQALQKTGTAAPSARAHLYHSMRSFMLLSSPACHLKWWMGTTLSAARPIHSRSSGGSFSSASGVSLYRYLSAKRW